jgi:hypothetical protein
MNNTPQYPTVENRPIGCNFCGAQVHGRVNQVTNPQTKKVTSECRWTCGRCGNLVKIGNVN